MNKEDILKRYKKEKDEGKLFIERRSLLRGFNMMMIVAIFLMIMSFLLTGDDFITNIVFIMILPFLFIFYGTKGYYTKSKIYCLTSGIWFILYLMKFYTLIQDVL